MECSLEQRQVQSLTPEMIQTMKLLQMGAMELRDYIQEQLQENPALESEEFSAAGADDGGRLAQKLDWLYTSDRQDSWYAREDEWDPMERIPGSGGADLSEESLYDHLRAQIAFRTLSPALRDAVECVLESLDAAGRLEESVEDLSAAAGCSRQAVAEAIELVQALEPAGVAARDLSECLTLQLKRRGVTGLALTVARDHLEDIGRGRYHRIAQDTGASAAQVQAACRLIRSLDPRPGCGFGPPESAGYIVPDLAVLPGEDGLQVVANDEYLPTLRLSGYYRQLLQTTQDAQVREYLSAKVDQAKWVMGHIEQRRTTLLSCARCIVAMQEDFFRRGPGHLAPLTLAQAAERLHIHESTVSRAIRGKYLQCTYGVFPMKYFFCRALPTARGEDVSTQRAKEALREWIDREDKRKPYSDQALSESLRAQGILLSRRTVAKYRDELGIPSAAGRRTL